MEFIREYFRLKVAFEALQELDKHSQEPELSDQTTDYSMQVSLTQRAFDALRRLFRGIHAEHNRDFHSSIR